MPVMFLAPKQGKAAPGMGWHFLPVSKRHLMMLGGSALCENVRQKSSSEYSWFDVVVESLSHVQFFVIPPARLPCSSLSISQSLLKLMSNELVMPSNHLIFFRPLLLLPSVFPNIRVFSNESAHHHPINTAWRSKHGQLAQPHPWHQRKRQLAAWAGSSGHFWRVEGTTGKHPTRGRACSVRGGDSGHHGDRGAAGECGVHPGDGAQGRDQNTPAVVLKAPKKTSS